MLFPEIEQTTPLFPVGTEPKKLDTNTEEQQNTTALYAALAQQRHIPTNQSLDMQIDSALEQIQGGDEDNLRARIDQITKDTKIQATRSAQTDYIKSPIPYQNNNISLGDLLRHEQSIAAAPTDPYALEKEAIKRVQELPSTGDDSLDYLTKYNILHGGVVEQTTANLQKAAIFNQYIDKFQKTYDNEGLGWKILDFFQLPLQEKFSSLFKVGTPDTELLDAPSTRLQKEVNELWSNKYTVDQFQKKLTDLTPSIQNWTGLLAKNNSLSLQTLERFKGLTKEDALSYDLWAVADIASILPIGRIAEAIKDPSKLLLLSGRRDVARQLDAQAIIKDATNAGNVTGTSKVENAETAVENVIPSYAKVETSDLLGAVPTGSDVVRDIEALKTADLNKILVKRLEPEQEKEAVDQAIAKAKMQYGDKLVDIKRAEVSTRVETSNVILENQTTDPVKQFGNFGIEKNGKSIGQVHTFYDEETKDISIQWIGQHWDYDLGPKKGTIGPQDLKPSAVRNLLRQLKAQYPDAKTIGGDRISGARWGQYGRGNYGANTDALMDISAVKPAHPIAESDIQNFENEGGALGSYTPRGKPTFETDQEASTNLQRLHFYLGNDVTGGGFSSLDIAKQHASDYGFNPETVGYQQNVDGQWFIKHTDIVNETGILSPALKPEDLFPVGSVGAFFRSPSHWMAGIFNSARLAGTVARNQIIKDVFAPKIKAIQSLSRGSQKTLQKILAKGSDEQKWYSVSDLVKIWKDQTGKLPTNKEIVGYYATKEAYDGVYEIFNLNLYTDKARRGIHTVQIKDALNKFDSGRINGKVLDYIPNNQRIYDVESGTHVKEGGRSLAEWINTGPDKYVVVQLEEAKTIAGEPVRYVFAPKASVEVSALERQQLKYVPGGSRENVSTIFVKQARKGSFKDGTMYYHHPITHIAARTTKEAKQWAERMEAARAAFNRIEATAMDSGSSLADRQAIEASPVKSLAKWRQMVKEGTIQKDTPFEVLNDKELPSEMVQQRGKYTDLSNPEKLSEESYFDTKGRMYYSDKSAERLRDPTGELATILDPFRTLSRAINTAANTRAFSDYNRKVIEEWYRVAKPWLAVDPGDAHSAFFHGELNKAKPHDQGFYSSLDLHREQHKKFLQIENNQQSKRSLYTRQLADWLDRHGVDVGVGKYRFNATSVMDTMSRNPVAAIRGFVFDPMLGWFDPGQLIVQSQTAVAAMTVHPVWGTRAALMAAPMHWLTVNREGSLLDYLSKKLSFVHGLPPEEFKTLVKSFNRTGWREVGGEQLLIHHMGNAVGGNIVAQGYRSIQQKGRYFFTVAERFNRIVGYQIAWNKIKKELPELAVGSDEFLRAVNVASDDLTFNMTSASRAAWQTGIPSVPTQFLGYQSRMLEAMLPKWGNTRFTAAQRGRLIAGQFMLYGTAGVPLGTWLYDYVSDSYATATGEQVTPEVHRALTKGFFDNAMYYLTSGELDTDFAHRAGTGAGWSDWFKKLSNGELSSTLEFFGGASGTYLNDLTTSAKKLTQYFKAEQLETLSPEGADIVLNEAVIKHVNSLKRANKAYWIWKTGKLRDERTGENIVDATKLEGYAALLGIPLNEEEMKWDIINNQKDREGAVTDYANQLAVIRRRAYQAYGDGDEKSATAYERQATALMQIFRDNPQMQDQIVQKTDQILGYNQDEFQTLVEKNLKTFNQLPKGVQ